MQVLCLMLLVGLPAICLGSGGGGAAISSDSSVDIEGGMFTKLVPGQKMILTCDPQREDLSVAKTSWLKGKDVLASDANIFVNETTLEITKTTDADIGTYFCVDAVEDGYEVRTRRYEVAIININRLMPSRTITHGETLNLTCSVTGQPRPTVTWTKDNVEVVADEHTEITESPGEFVPEGSTLIINNVDQADRGHYKCNITLVKKDNVIVITTMETNVRVKGLYAALWPFLGIVAEVVILCAVIFFFERRRKDSDADESDTDTGKNGQ